MNDVTSMLIYMSVPVEAMQALDDERRRAEESSTDAKVWASLAQRYHAQGRPAQAGSCERRAEHYARVAAVSTETESERVYA